VTVGDCIVSCRLRSNLQTGSERTSIACLLPFQQRASWLRSCCKCVFVSFSAVLNCVVFSDTVIDPSFYTVSPKNWDLCNLEYLACTVVSLLQWNLACDILTTLAIKRIHNLPPHLSYVSTLPDIAQKPESYVVFLLIVWVALKRTGLGVSEVALKRVGCVARSQ